MIGVSRAHGVASAPAGTTHADVTFSDWRTATGATDNALGDGPFPATSKWNHIPGTFVESLPVLSVVTRASAGLADAPSINVLRVAHWDSATVAGIGNTPSGQVGRDGLWPSPQIGESRYFRIYLRVDTNDDEGDLTNFNQGINSHHPLEEGSTGSVGASDYQMNHAPKNDGTFLWYFGTNQGGGAAEANRWKPVDGSGNWVALNKGQFYRFEWKITKVGSGSYNLDIRIYNNAGTLIYDGTTLANIKNSTGTSVTAAPLVMDDTNIGMVETGTNGGSCFSSLTRTEYEYWAAFACSAVDWPGAYNPAIG